jgi:hypothetical protein
MTEAALPELGINRRTIIQSQNSNAAARSDLVGDKKSPEDEADYCRNRDKVKPDGVNDESQLVPHQYSAIVAMGNHEGLDTDGL